MAVVVRPRDGAGSRRTENIAALRTQIALVSKPAHYSGAGEAH
ncbi:Protein of unknown function [Propionibacterium freudenreichii]|nr:Protein of unknown function [Propionibacterium freudenreichii]CEI49045.1 Protein of unknown function [Propionibacterium freudenreichii]